VKNKKINKPGISGLTGSNKSKIYILFLILVPLILYFRVIYFEFTTYDDTDIISKNYNIIKNLENIPKVFTTDIFMTGDNSFYRPLQNISFMIDTQLSGKNPWAYHLTNIILHILSVLVLFVFLKQINIKDDIAFLLSLLFSVHPMIASPICWIPARADLLLTLLGLLSFVSFINYFNTQKTKYKVFHLLCFLPLFFAKETAIVFPILLLFYFYFILQKKSSFRQIIPFLIIWGFSFVIYLVFRKIAIKVTDPSSVFGIIPLVKNLPAIPIIFGKIFVPQGLTTMPLFNWVSIIVGIIVFMLFITIIIKAGISKNIYFIFGSLWFICFILPPMFFRLPAAEYKAEYFEHRTGLPIIGILIIMGILLNMSLKKIGYKKLMGVSLLVIISFAVISWYHSNDYSDPLSFFSAAIKSNSDNVIALNLRAGIYFNEGNFTQSVQDLDNAIRYCPVFCNPYTNKGYYYRTKNDHNLSEHFYSLALKYDTLYPEINLPQENIYADLSAEKINLHKYDEAIVLLKKGIVKYPGNCKLHINLGIAYFNNTKFDSALFEYNKGIELEQNVPLYYNYRGMTKYHLDDFTGALNDFNRALELKPDFLDALGNRGKTKIKLNDFEGAVSDLTKAISIKQNIGAAWYYRGLAFSKLNRINEAKWDWKKAVELGYKEAIEQLNKYK
jgi:tetratricopeptide (TPR) repeat protein